MKARLGQSSGSSSSFSLELEPENSDEAAALERLAGGGRYTFSHAGHKYMDSSFYFHGYIPSND